MEDSSNKTFADIMDKASLASPHKTIQSLMSTNIGDAKYILNLARDYNMMDSQEFLDWQDELNAISIEYK